MERVQDTLALCKRAYGRFLAGGLCIVAILLSLEVPGAVWGIVAVFLCGPLAVWCALSGAYLARRAPFDWHLRLVSIAAVLFGGGIVALLASIVLSAEVPQWLEWALTAVTLAYAIASIGVGGWWFLHGRKVEDAGESQPGRFPKE